MSDKFEQFIALVEKWMEAKAEGSNGWPHGDLMESAFNDLVEERVKEVLREQKSLEPYMVIIEDDKSSISEGSARKEETAHEDA